MSRDFTAAELADHCERIAGHITNDPPPNHVLFQAATLIRTQAKQLAARSSGATALDELLTPVKLTGLIYDYQGTRRLSDIHADLVALLSPWAEQQQAQIQTLTREVERLQAEATEFSNRPAMAAGLTERVWDMIDLVKLMDEVNGPEKAEGSN